MTNSQKESQFLDWLMGADVEFPYFKNFPDIPQPDLRTLAERRNEELSLKEPE